ncbi:hypothetical protein AeMF1_001387, partial [Aphanomyces euteiches]
MDNMANTRAFWYIQINEQRAADIPTSLCLPEDSDVNAFKQATAKNSRNTHNPSTIVIYANQDAFQAKRPLFEKDKLSDHGTSSEVPIIVEIQPPLFPYTPAAQWYDSIMECKELPPVSLLRDKVRGPLSTLIPISKEAMAAFTSERTDDAEDCSRCHKKRKLTSFKMIYLDYFNLESLSGRLNLFRSLVNIAPHLWRVAEMCPHPVREWFSCLDENFVDIDEYEGATVVVKTFRSEVAAQRIEYLKVVYEVMKNANVPNVDRLVHCGKYYARLSPVGAGGFPFCRFPTNEQTVLEAIQSILEALVVLHSVGWMHRDIRWSNVIKPANQSKWFLIDFDHAATSPQDNSKDERLTSEEHAPDMFG